MSPALIRVECEPDLGSLAYDSGLVREEVLAATRTRLLRVGAVTDGYAGIELA
jgi:hypothetical protein